MRPCVTAPLLIRDTEFGGPKPLFCVPLVATDLKELRRQANIAHQLQADVVEWRADSYADFSVESLVEAGHALRRSLEHEPILFTPRIRSEGGACELNQDVRVRCIDAVLRITSIDLVDIELVNGPEIIGNVIQTAHANSKRVIVSFHDFQSTPSNEILFDKLASMVRQGADIAKIACMPRHPADVLRLLQVTLDARQAFPRVPLCTISMGGLGLLSRMAGFLYGSDMTFAAGAAASAPGQIALAEARALTELLIRNI